MESSISSAGEHILRGHAGGRLRLVSVPEDGIRDEQGLVR